VLKKNDFGHDFRLNMSFVKPQILAPKVYALLNNIIFTIPRGARSPAADLITAAVRSSAPIAPIIYNYPYLQAINTNTSSRQRSECNLFFKIIFSRRLIGLSSAAWEHQIWTWALHIF
jgi:hypothetical protein